MYKIYTKDDCGYCTMAKFYMEEHNIDYEEINVEGNINGNDETLIKNFPWS